MKQISLGEKIKKLRNEKDLTQEELARKAEIPYATLMKIENEQVKNPTVGTLKKIADALEVTVDYFLN